MVFTNNLEHISFKGIPPPQNRRVPHLGHLPFAKYNTTVPETSAESMDAFVAWVLDKSGMDSTAYRPRPLNRRRPACLRALKASSPEEARRVIRKNPELLPVALNALLIGATSFFRDRHVFETLAEVVLPALANRSRAPRIWSAGCSNGSELYSVAILLSEAGICGGSTLVGTDCRGDLIEHARIGAYDKRALQDVNGDILERCFEPFGACMRPVGSIRAMTSWKVADFLNGTEDGPWDIIMWRNAAIYLNDGALTGMWRALKPSLAPDGFLILGKAERPPNNLGFVPICRSVYRRLGA